MDKPMGMKDIDFEELQGYKAAQDFEISVKNRIRCLEALVETLKTSIEALIGKQGADKVASDATISNGLDALSKTLSEFRKIQDTFQYDVTTNRDMLKKTYTEQNNYVLLKDFHEKFLMLENHVKSFKTEKEAFKADFSRIVQDKFAEISDKMESFKAYLAAKPAEMPSLQKIIEEKIELAELNGQNSILRSSNNERHIQLLERKIENIYQLLKKIDMSTQEHS